MNKNEAQTGSLPAPHVGPLGECGLLFTFAPQEEQAQPMPVPLPVQQRVWALSEWLAERRQEFCLREIVPGMGNLLVVADPISSRESLAETVLALWPTLQPRPESGRTVEIPVQYGSGNGEDNGPDMALVAAHTGLSVTEIIRRHSEAIYQVYCLGFQPGFGYLASLDPSLATPRRDTPRVRTPAGSVAIGGNQTGIYPSTGPGGWQIIGRTSLVLFDPGRDSPSLLQPGDSVRFVPGGSA